VKKRFSIQAADESFWLWVVNAPIGRPIEKDDDTGPPKLFAGMIFYAGCKRSGVRVRRVHANGLAPIHRAEDMAAFATAIFSLTRQERSNPFKPQAFFDFQESRMAVWAHFN
jgi:hypothetical protein